MKTIVLAIAALAIAAPAFAQTGWNSQSYDYGNGMGQTFYNGTGDNQGWNGSSQSYNYGNGMGQTFSNFNGPNGETETCSTQTYPTGQTFTNCN